MVLVRSGKISRTTYVGGESLDNYTQRWAESLIKGIGWALLKKCKGERDSVFLILPILIQLIRSADWHCRIIDILSVPVKPLNPSHRHV
jgi:hypothetical protein